MKTLLWEDSISGTPPLSSVPQLHELMNWFKNKGLNRLADICKWGFDGNWSGWNFPDLPVQFNSHKSVMISHLLGLAPVHFTYKDRWGWGADGFYSAANAFQALLPVHNSSFTPTIWHSVWHSCLPKVNFYVWLLLKNKILTGDNLQKRGFNGPFRCYFCQVPTEMADHLLVGYNFAR